ncbi:MAG: hypothetical protein Q9187_007085 [Circinaria calcarea]
MQFSHFGLFNCFLWIASTILPTALTQPFHAATSDSTGQRNAVLGRRSTDPASVVCTDPAEVTGRKMRILPLGDSITYGFLSTDGCGYRKELLQELTDNSNTVQYIGSQHSGNMTNNANEGHGGYRIAEIAAAAVPTLSQRPSIILLMAGTNDIIANYNLTTAPDRLRSLIQQLVKACPDAAVLVAPIIPSGEDDRQHQTDIYNTALTSVVDDFATRGLHVLEVSMPTTRADLVDGIHPTDQGYLDMGDAWFVGINRAGKKGWIGDPVVTVSSGKMKEKLEQR